LQITQLQDYSFIQIKKKNTVLLKADVFQKLNFCSIFSQVFEIIKKTDGKTVKLPLAKYQLENISYYNFYYK
jgi:hypothetical protein